MTKKELTPEQKAKKKLLADERRRKKAADEYKAMNNVVSPSTKQGRAKAPTNRSAAPRTTEQILKERKRIEKGRGQVRKSLKRVSDGSSKRWRGWRESDGQSTAPVVTYNIKDETN